MAQTELQLAMANPQLHNLYEAFHDMYQAIGVKDVDKILPPLNHHNHWILLLKIF